MHAPVALTQPLVHAALHVLSQYAPYLPSVHVQDPSWLHSPFTQPAEHVRSQRAPYLVFKSQPLVQLPVVALKPLVEQPAGHRRWHLVV